jgi:phosphatidylglycerol:prolipoprotein diacylglycerol transferase
MHPVLFQWGPLALHSYGLMLAIGFLSALQLALRRSRELSIDPEVVQNLAFLVLGFGIAGARAAYVLLFWEMFRGNPLEIIRLDHGGLIFYGGLAGGVLAGVIYLKGKRLLSWRMADLVIPPVALAHAIGRLGCFLNGCCYGKPFLGPWAVAFPPEEILRHPVQLYESGFLFSLFFALKLLEGRHPREGTVALTYGLLYGTWRFLIEFVRADNLPWALGLTIFQWMSLLLVFVCGSLLYATHRSGQQPS